MHHLKLLTARTLAVAAVAAVVIAVGALATPRDTLANVSDPTGVFCGNFQNASLNVYGISLSRIDYDFVTGGNANDIAFTGIAYIANNPNTLPNCQTEDQDPLGVPFEDQSPNRPNIVGKYVQGGGVNNDGQITASECLEDIAFGPAPPGWAILTVQVDLNKAGAQKATGTFSFQGANPGGNPPATCSPTGSPITMNVTSVYFDGPGGSISGYNHDWDKDGCRDWDELARVVSYDPFNPNDCSAGVGGVAELPGEPVTPLQTSDSSGGSTGLIIALVTAGVAAVAATGGGAWALRRRINR